MPKKVQWRRLLTWWFLLLVAGMIVLVINFVLTFTDSARPGWLLLVGLALAGPAYVVLFRGFLRR